MRVSGSLSLSKHLMSKNWQWSRVELWETTMDHSGTALCNSRVYRVQYTAAGTSKNFRTSSTFPILSNVCQSVTQRFAQ
jgi:hypothetical protein